MKDSLGDRIKRQYEDRTRYFLPRRTFTIVRVDGKAFHTLTEGLDKPWDRGFVMAMNEVAASLVNGCQGACFAYTQSDETSVLLQDFKTIRTDAWFDGNIQKICSVAVSIATASFNDQFKARYEGEYALFDARVFTIPDPVEVENYFIWRQQDAVRNSIQSLAQSMFPHKELEGLSCDQLQEKMHREKQVNWSKQEEWFKRGRVTTPGDNRYPMYRTPMFTSVEGRDLLQQLIPKRED